LFAQWLRDQRTRAVVQPCRRIEEKVCDGAVEPILATRPRALGTRDGMQAGQSGITHRVWTDRHFAVTSGLSLKRD
jgi:hypothetical protein